MASWVKVKPRSRKQLSDITQALFLAQSPQDCQQDNVRWKLKEIKGDTGSFGDRYIDSEGRRTWCSQVWFSRARFLMTMAVQWGQFIGQHSLFSTPFRMIRSA